MADTKNDLPEQTPEQKQAQADHDAAQAALQAGGGDTRITPVHPDHPHKPLIVWPLEQATVPVDVHHPGPSIRVHNKNPVPAPSGTATGVAPDQLSVSGDNSAGLTGALRQRDVPVVDVAANATSTPEEITTPVPKRAAKKGQ